MFVTGFHSEKIPKGLAGLVTPILSDITGNYDIVFHQAANNDTRDMDRLSMFFANVYEPIVMFNNLSLAGCTRFVYASSTAVYGNQPAPYTEDTPTEPLNPYAESKLAFDQFAMEFAKRKEVYVTGLRYCNVYGPGEGHKGPRMSMVGQMLRKAMDNKEIKLFHDGYQLRDWMYIEDAVRANILASEVMRTGIYNIGSGEARTFLDILDVIKKTLQQKVTASWVDCPFEDEYQKHTECNIDKAYTEFGYQPRFSLEQGIRQYYSSF